LGTSRFIPFLRLPQEVRDLGVTSLLGRLQRRPAVRSALVHFGARGRKRTSPDCRTAPPREAGSSRFRSEIRIRARFQEYRCLGGASPGADEEKRGTSAASLPSTEAPHREEHASTRRARRRRPR
jgi:hypothetical protein